MRRHWPPPAALLAALGILATTGILRNGSWAWFALATASSALCVFMGLLIHMMITREGTNGTA